MAEENAQRLVNKALSLIKKEDITHRGFLKPIEISLKTYRTDGDKLKAGSLPAGLKVVVKESLDSNSYTLEDITEVQPHSSYTQIRDRSQDNMLALMKQEQGLELAICICMYSEDKRMLKKTLAGVEDNIANLVAFEGLEPDQIGVFVIMDGIQKVDGTVVDYFEQLERSSNINLGTNIAPSLTKDELARRAARMDEEEIEDEEFTNINNFLFNPAELEERERMRFESVRSKYMQRHKLLDTIKQLKKGLLLYESLPSSLQAYFLKEVKLQRKRDCGETDEQIEKMPQDVLIESYITDIRKVRPLVAKTLFEASRNCKEYISTREDLAHLSYFRKKIHFSPRHNLEKGREEGDGQELNEQLEETKVHTFMNLFMCVKYKNSKKLSSHNWFFNGFCKELRPKYAVLLDVGLKPEQEALLKMYKYMKVNENIGGVCGYMSLKIEKMEEGDEVKDDEVDCLTSIAMKFVDIQRTQQVEYHFAHLMDKPFESSFGFIHVLPGAFSAYNMKAIFDYNSKNDDQLLKDYFKSIDEKVKERKVIKSHISVRNAILRTVLPDFINHSCISVDPESDEAMLYDENVYLAEDRILCMGIHKRGKDMAFLPDAYAEVDPMKTVHELLGQRKRWINGSYFAFEKVKRELALHEKENGFECILNLQIFYLTLMNTLSYFSPSLFLFTVHIAMEAFRADVLTKVLAGVVSDPNTSEFYNAFVFTMDFIYVLLIMTIVFFSLHLSSNNKRFKPYIYAVSTIFGLLMIAVFLVLAIDIFRGLINNDAFLTQSAQAIESVPGGVDTINTMRWILVGSLAIYIVPIVTYIFLFGNFHILWEIVLGAFSFLFYGPTYLNILNIYSLCRIDDISWGTKGLDAEDKQSSTLSDSWKLIKFVHVAKYVIWNIIVSAVLLTLGSSYLHRFFVTFAIVVLIGVSMSVKVVVGTLYMIVFKCKTFRCCASNVPNVNISSRISRIIDEHEPHIRKEITQNLNDAKNEYLKVGFIGSFIQASRRQSTVEIGVGRMHTQQLQKSTRLKVESVVRRKDTYQRAMARIDEETASPSPRKNFGFMKSLNSMEEVNRAIDEGMNDYSLSRQELNSSGNEQHLKMFPGASTRKISLDGYQGGNKKDKESEKKWETEREKEAKASKLRNANK